MADEFEIGGTDRPKAIFDLEDLISSGGFTDYGLETSLWNELAPELGGFDPNSPEFQAALDELIASGVANISTASAGTTKDIVDAILGTIDVTDGVSQEDINAAIAVLDSNLVTIEDLAAIVGIPVETISAVYEASKPTVDDLVLLLKPLSMPPLLLVLQVESLLLGRILYNYSLDTPKELTDEEIAAIQAAAAAADAAKVLEGQLEEAIAAETDPLLKARLEVELAKLKNQPTEALEAEVARLETEAASVITGDPTQIGGNTVFTTDTSGLSDDAKNVTLTPGQDITIVDTGTGTPAVDGDTKILTKEEKDAAFNEVLAGVDENTAIADVVAAAVKIYGETADAVVAVAGAANSANVSAEDLANATGTSIEDINKAAEDANVAITNQETAASKAAADAAAADAAAAAAAVACALSGGIMVDGVCVDVDDDDDDDTETAEEKAAREAAEAAAAKAACDAAGGNIVNGECVCPTGYSKVDGKCVADGSGTSTGNCPEGSGQIKVDGKCVCPSDKPNFVDGKCVADGSGTSTGNCTGGRTRDPITQECVCPSDKPNFVDGKCVADGSGTSTGNCTGGRTRDPITQECVCPSDKPNFNEATQQCEGGGGQGNCTGGRTRDPITQECVCPSNKPNFNEATQQCEGGGGQGNCTGGRTRDPITQECVCPSISLT
jgi:hypothetical protein